MSVKSKKGRNLGAVDNWLDSIGLYRKNVAYDETCLFRAISEQLFQSQIYHERVRRECVDYGRQNYFEFWDLLDSEYEWYEHMDLLEKHMVFCGNVELQIISNKYNYDILLYDAVQQKVINATGRDLGKYLMLCRMNEDHYDVVYKKEHIQNAGFCQSIIYNILYEKVFHVENVQDIVQGMLYKKEFVAPSFGEINNNLDQEPKEDIKGEDAPTMPPFPFKIAKALDPTIYRNIEYDTWTEVRREMRLGEWYYGDDNLILGTKCLLNRNDRTFECYIQEIIKNKNKCVVYVTKLAEKLTVNYTDLSPEDDAKPWPLPYRFAKNLVVSTPSHPPEKTLKLAKKRKDKRRNKSNSESSAQCDPVTQPEPSEQDIKAFIGAPLQMRNASYETQETPPKTAPETPMSQHNLLVTPEIPSPAPKFSWDSPWNNYAPSASQQVVWSPPNINYLTNPMVASAPVTPDVIPYHGSRYPFIYNYHMDNYSPYNSWAGFYDYNSQSNQDSAAVGSDESEEKIDNRHAEASGLYSDHYEPQVVEERPTLCTFLPSPNSHVEMYSPVIPVSPGTPVIYAHTPEMTEIMLQPPPLQVYTPPVDLQYVPSAPFIYTPTPPAGWHPSGITSQGFAFPSAVNQNLQSK